ncbi:FAD-dependent oxidoreductase [Anaerolineales bacterium HSG24]|nr:FAD-dependent oxidoreductase [Anaerolineales bacterium HSG24]
MKKVDVLIVGGSASGFAAAFTARRHYPDASIAVIRQEDKTPIPCGIPYIFGTLGSPEKNLMPDGALDKNGVELIKDEVTAINREKKTIITASGQEIGYEKMILGTGSLPLVPPIPGADLDNVFVMKKDVSYLSHLLEILKSTQDVVIIGGGFIGLEMADECHKLGCQNITVVEMLSHCLFTVFDEDLCIRLENELKKVNIQVQTSQKVKSLVGNGKVEYVELDDGRQLKADAVILGIGVYPNVAVGQQAGLTIGPTSAIVVDRHMLTNDSNIFAVGDCAEKVSFFTGQPVKAWLASVATAEARIAAANLFEMRRTNKGAVSVFSTKIGNIASGLAGIRETDARETGIAYVIGEAEAPDRHPGSLPGATKLRVKLVFHKYSGVLIGGQVCGGDSVGELVNLLAAMIQAEMNADQIATFQMGTHPLLTASPVAYQVVNAAEVALGKMC